MGQFDEGLPLGYSGGMVQFLLVCVGGAVGTGARYLLSGWSHRAFGSVFPWGTLAVNLIGSFLVMIVMHLSVHKGFISPTLWVVLSTGVLGGFTTYSAFNLQSLQLFQNGSMLLGLINVGATVIGCLLAGAAGLLVARWMT